MQSFNMTICLYLGHFNNIFLQHYLPQPSMTMASKASNLVRNVSCCDLLSRAYFVTCDVAKYFVEDSGITVKESFCKLQSF